MLYLNIITATLLASASASTIPLTKRAEWNVDGNIHLTFSKNSVKVGDLTLDMIMGDMGAACHGEGNCETTDIEKKSILWGKDSQKEWKVTLSPTGTYVSWIRNGLLDALGAAVKEVVKCESGTYTNKCFGSSAMAYCPGTKTKWTNCEMPESWTINYQPKDQVMLGSPPSLTMSIKAEEKGSNGICEKALSAMGTIAGAIPGPGAAAGAGFTLASMVCE